MVVVFVSCGVIGFCGSIIFIFLIRGLLWSGCASKSFTKVIELLVVI